MLKTERHKRKYGKFMAYYNNGCPPNSKTLEIKNENTKRKKKYGLQSAFNIHIYFVLRFTNRLKSCVVHE